MASRISSSVRQSNTKGKGKDQDYLTSLPPELLIKIIAHTPSKCYLDLVHTSKSLRTFLKLNASRICNQAIRTRYPLEAKLLETTNEAGWLVPTNTRVKKEERQYINDKRLLNYKDRRYFTLLGVVGKECRNEDVRISIMSPGPHYLYFLEQILLRVGQMLRSKCCYSMLVGYMSVLMRVLSKSSSMERCAPSLYGVHRRTIAKSSGTLCTVWADDFYGSRAENRCRQDPSASVSRENWFGFMALIGYGSSLRPMEERTARIGKNCLCFCGSDDSLFREQGVSFGALENTVASRTRWEGI